MLEELRLTKQSLVELDSRSGGAQADVTRHVIGRRFIQGTRVQIRVDEVVGKKGGGYLLKGGIGV